MCWLAVSVALMAGPPRESPAPTCPPECPLTCPRGDDPLPHPARSERHRVDYGASSPTALPSSTFYQSSGLAPRQGGYAFPPGSAANNRADIFRAGIGEKGGSSY